MGPFEAPPRNNHSTLVSLIPSRSLKLRPCAIAGVITTTLLFSPLITKLRGRTWRRTIADTLINHLTYWLPTDTISAGAAAPDDLYRGWAKANNQDPVIDETVEGGQLVWMGPKNAEHVILYFHGNTIDGVCGMGMLLLTITST